MTKGERNEIYTKIFSFIIENNLDTHPVSFQQICEILKIQLVPISEILSKTSLKHRDIFDIWGNDDGVVAYNAKKNSPYNYKIAYNDSKPPGRIRFTIAEEISHVLLGHVNYPEFNLFDQCFSTDIYKKFDREARICSGFLLLSPKFYYNYKDILTLDLITERFQITEDCAKTRCTIYDTYYKEISGHPLYPYLPDPKADQYEVV